MRENGHLHATGGRGDGLEGALRCVVRAREVPEPELPHAGSHEPRGELGALGVRQVPQVARDASLEARRVRAEGEELGAVVRLDDRGVAGAEQVDELVRHVADVGRDPERVIVRGDPDRDLRRVVRNDGGADLEGADAERLPGGELPDRALPPDARRIDPRMEIDRRPERARKSFDLPEVVAVLVGRDDRIDPARQERFAEGREPLLRAFRPDSRVDQHTCAVRFDEHRVAARSGGQHEGPHGHRCSSPAPFAQAARSRSDRGRLGVESPRSVSSPSHHRLCPQCGAPLAEQARFCGQCGAVLAAPAPKSPHEEETVARPMPNLEAFERELAASSGGIPTPIASAMPEELAAIAREKEAAKQGQGGLLKTIVDVAPLGAGAPPAPPAPSPSAATSLGIPAVTPDALGRTINDPGTEERARAVREAVAKAEAAKAPAPGGSLGKTLFLGGAPAPESVHNATTAVQKPIAPPPEGAAEPDPRRPDASPLSRSVLAPQSWMPPAPTGGVVAAPVVPAQPEAPAPAPAPAPPNAAHTVLGMPAAALPASRGALPAQPEPAPAPPAAPVFGSAAKTMLGVAIPGIAPTHTTTGSAPTMPSPEPGPPSAAAALPSKQGTLLGVAIPGIAPGAPPPAPAPGARPAYSGTPTAYGMGAVAPPPPPIVPAPPPLQDEPIPAAPAMPAKRGVPAVAVVAIVMVLVAIGGVAIVFAMRGGAPLTAQPQLDDTGRESLRLTCASCPDGTTVKLGASAATIQAHAAVLPLPAPLSIGDNTLTVAIDRPATGRDEEVKIHVPVAYRVRADLTTLSASPPAITVRVEAVPGTDVRVEGKPLALDAEGKGAYALDVTQDVEGPSDETKTIERKIPFSITPKDGKPETGELLARVVVSPLHVDAPGLVLYTEKASAPFAGQTKPGATVTVAGTPAPLDAQGRFAVRAELPAGGERTFPVVATAAPLAPRTARVRVVRVQSLEATAKELEAKSPVPFGVFSKDPAGNVGKDGVVEGAVVRANIDASHSVLLVEDKKSCAGAPCLVRILHGEEVKAATGDTVRAFGRVNGTVTAGGQTVPELDASLVLVTRGAKK